MFFSVLGLTSSDRLVAFDTETTGLSVIKDRIVEITLLQKSLSSPLQIFTSKINPGIPIPKHVSKIHRITDNQVKNAPTLLQLIPWISPIIEQSILIGYNSQKFDEPLLKNSFSRIQNASFSHIKQHLDVYLLAKK